MFKWIEATNYSWYIEGVELLGLGLNAAFVKAALLHFGAPYQLLEKEICVENHHFEVPYQAFGVYVDVVSMIGGCTPLQ